MGSRARQPLAFDHRGRACELIDPVSADLPLEVKEALPEPGWRSKGPGAEGHWSMVATELLGYAVAAPVILLVTSPWKWLILFVPVGTGAWRFIGPISRSWRRAAATAIIETMLRFGLCPGCGYPLEHLAAGDDGCAQCPECGARWRAAAIGSGNRAVGAGM